MVAHRHGNDGKLFPLGDVCHEKKKMSIRKPLVFLGDTRSAENIAIIKQRRWGRICVVAHRHLKPFHYGRAGTLRKLQHAFAIGANSLDSSFPLWTKENANILRYL